MFHLLDMAVVNAYILYTTSEPAKKLTHEQFRIELSRQLLLQASVDVREDMPQSHGRLHRPLPPQSRLTERHFPDHLPCTPSGKKGQTECTVCSKKKGRGRKTTTYMCRQCKLPVCIHVLNCTTPKSTHNGTCENSPHPLQHSTLCFVISPSPSRYLPFIMYMYNIHGTHSYTFYIVIACTCHLRLK